MLTFLIRNAVFLRAISHMPIYLFSFTSKRHWIFLILRSRSKLECSISTWISHLVVWSNIIHACTVMCACTLMWVGAAVQMSVTRMNWGKWEGREGGQPHPRKLQGVWWSSRSKYLRLKRCCIDYRRERESAVKTLWFPLRSTTKGFCENLEERVVATPFYASKSPLKWSC